MMIGISVHEMQRHSHHGHLVLTHGYCHHHVEPHCRAAQLYYYQTYNQTHSCASVLYYYQIKTHSCASLHQNYLPHDHQPHSSAALRDIQFVKWHEYGWA